MIKTISVYCASSTQIAPEYFEAARRLGQLMAERNITLVNGAGSMGLMAASTDGCMEKGGHTIGIIPQFMIDEGWCHRGMSEVITTQDMHQRQRRMAELGDAAIVLPGGCGTLAEMSELIVLKQLGIYLKPIILLNTRNYYEPLLDALKRAVDEHFMRPEHSNIWQVAQTPEEAIELAINTPLWNVGIRRFAKI